MPGRGITSPPYEATTTAVNNKTTNGSNSSWIAAAAVQRSERAQWGEAREAAPARSPSRRKHILAPFINGCSSPPSHLAPRPGPSLSAAPGSVIPDVSCAPPSRALPSPVWHRGPGGAGPGRSMAGLWGWTSRWTRRAAPRRPGNYGNGRRLVSATPCPSFPQARRRDAQHRTAPHGTALPARSPAGRLRGRRTANEGKGVRR